MAGILNSKQRVIDVVITELGRKLYNEGRFDVQYVSFSDSKTIYIVDEEGTLNREDSGIAFEAYSDIKDEIIPIIDNVGDLVEETVLSPTLFWKDGKLVEETTEGYVEVDVYDKTDDFLNISKSRFKNLGILQTKISNLQCTEDNILKNLEIDINQYKSWNELQNSNSLKKFTKDTRFIDHHINMMFLPPVALSEGVYYPLNAYEGLEEKVNMQEIISDLSINSDNINIQTINGDETNTHDYIGQVWIKKDGVCKKLLILNGGTIADLDGDIIKELYYCGFLYKNQFGYNKFINTCTLIFEKEV